MNDRFLSGRTALVTGSTSGIGLAIATALAEAGAAVAINGLGQGRRDGQAYAGGAAGDQRRAAGEESIVHARPQCVVGVRIVLARRGRAAFVPRLPVR